MAYDEGLAERIRVYLGDSPHQSEKKMFGGLAFLLSGNMCCGVVNDKLMARVGPDAYETLLHETHANTMDFTGRPMRGMIFVASEGIEEDQELHSWIDHCERFAGALPPK